VLLFVSVNITRRDADTTRIASIDKHVALCSTDTQRQHVNRFAALAAKLGLNGRVFDRTLDHWLGMRYDVDGKLSGPLQRTTTLKDQVVPPVGFDGLGM
jgi:hypothetical protein